MKQKTDLGVFPTSSQEMDPAYSHLITRHYQIISPCHQQYDTITTNKTVAIPIVEDGAMITCGPLTPSDNS